MIAISSDLTDRVERTAKIKIPRRNWYVDAILACNCYRAYLVLRNPSSESAKFPPLHHGSVGSRCFLHILVALGSDALSATQRIAKDLTEEMSKTGKISVSQMNELLKE